MLQFLAKLVIGAFAVMIASMVIPGVHIPNFITGLVVTAVLTLLNLVVKPLLVLLTIPVTVFSFGLFLLVINAIIILLAAELVPTFEVAGFWQAVLFSLVFSFVHALLLQFNQRLEARQQRRG